MTRTELKHEAQSEVLNYAMNTITALYDQDASPELIKEARKQIARIEKLFGYVPGSWKS